MIGALAGMTEVTIMQPTVAIKNALQEGRPLPRTPLAYYRGLSVSYIMFATILYSRKYLSAKVDIFFKTTKIVVTTFTALNCLQMNVGTMLPITAVQFGMNRVLEKAYIKAYDHPPGTAAGLGVAMGAGAASAFVSCPAEYVIIQQQRYGRSLMAELKHTIAERGALIAYKGLVSEKIRSKILLFCGRFAFIFSLFYSLSPSPILLFLILQSAGFVRESLYVAGYLGVVPLLRAKLNTIPSIRDLPGGALVISGVLSGLLATVTTQPADTIKTRMQAFPDVSVNPEYRSLVSTTRHIIKTEGFGTLFAGLLPRATRIVGAVFILNGTRNTAVEFLEKRRSAVATE